MMRGRRSWIATLVVVVLVCAWAFGAEREPTGYVQIRIVDASTGRPAAARLELYDLGRRRTFVPREALRIAGDCGWLPIHNWIPGAASWQMRRHLQPEVWNPYVGRVQFYAAGPMRARVPAGRYAVRVFKGIEYRVAETALDVRRAETSALRVTLERWDDPAARNWFSADDHLHISRPGRRFDPLIASWMEAEDLRVANLLQMGLSRAIHITPQHSFGQPSVFEGDDVLVASGQENPRTHVLGHAITLGAPRWIDFPKSYLQYDQVWREARRAGGISGFAHWGVGGADAGLALWIPERLLDFLEVLGFEFPYYDSWYELLNLGVRMAPTAGTDYPCSESLPGRERFYTRVDPPFTYVRWLDAVRRGRTFITNGPLIELRVNDANIGDEVRLDEPGLVRVEGVVRFDPSRDDVKSVDIIRAGDILRTYSARDTPGEIRVSAKLPVVQSTWIALRARGEKAGETPVDVGGLRKALTFVSRPSSDGILLKVPVGKRARPSAAHSAAIYITVAGSPAIAQQPKAVEAAESFLSRLDELEISFSEEKLPELAGFPGRGDGVSLPDLRTARAELLRDVERARAHFREWTTAAGK